MSTVPSSATTARPPTAPLAETEGNITTLQKLLWLGKVHTTVSAESIRFALRRRLAEHETTNRRWDEELRTNVWEDPHIHRRLGEDQR